MSVYPTRLDNPINYLFLLSLFNNRTTPTKLISTVRKPDHLSDLSISDDEIETTNNPQQQQQGRRFTPIVREILSTEVGDDFSASGEVSTMTFRIHSPARVVCHSPSPHREGSVLEKERAAKVSEDAKAKKKKTRDAPSSNTHPASKATKSLSFDQHVETEKSNTSGKLNSSSSNKNKSADRISSKGIRCCS